MFSFTIFLGLPLKQILMSGVKNDILKITISLSTNTDYIQRTKCDFLEKCFIWLRDHFQSVGGRLSEDVVTQFFVADITYLKKVFEFLREHDCFGNFTGCALLWSVFFGHSKNTALENSDMTVWALTSAFTDSPAVPRICVHVFNSALNLGQCSVGILTLHNGKWQGL